MFDDEEALRRGRIRSLPERPPLHKVETKGRSSYLAYAPDFLECAPLIGNEIDKTSLSSQARNKEVPLSCLESRWIPHDASPWLRDSMPLHLSYMTALGKSKGHRMPFLQIVVAQ